MSEILFASRMHVVRTWSIDTRGHKRSEYDLRIGDKILGRCAARNSSSPLINAMRERVESRPPSAQSNYNFLSGVIAGDETLSIGASIVEGRNQGVSIRTSAAGGRVRRGRIYRT